MGHPALSIFFGFLVEAGQRLRFPTHCAKSAQWMGHGSLQQKQECSRMLA
jgi:hypothetical protein